MMNDMISMGHRSYCSKLTVTVARCSDYSCSYCNICWVISWNQRQTRHLPGLKEQGVSARDWHGTRVFGLNG